MAIKSFQMEKVDNDSNGGSNGGNIYCALTKY